MAAALTVLVQTIAMPVRNIDREVNNRWRDSLLAGAFVGFYLGSLFGIRALAVSLELSTTYHTTFVLLATAVFRLVLLATARWNLI